MAGKEILSIILSAMVIAFVFIAMASTGLIKIEGLTPKAELKIDSKESFEKGENAVFKVQGKSSIEIKKIIYSSPNKKEEKACNEMQCTAEFSEMFGKTGVFLIEASIELTNNSKITEKKKITVTETGKKCSDKTLFGECSEEKPKYCNQGKLEENCELCGCDKGECTGKTCFYQGKLEIEEVYLQKPFAKPKEKINLSVKASEIPAGEFSIIVEIKDGEKIEKSETIKKSVCSSCSKIFDVEITAPEKEGSYEISLINQEQLYSAGKITIRNDSTSPKIPSGVIARKSEGKILIAWNPNQEDDLMEYRIYRSKEDSVVFTSYVFASSADKNQAGKELEIMQTNYFYVTAVDFFGNESKPSAVVEAT